MKQKKAKQDFYVMLFLSVLSLALILWVIPNWITVTKLMEQEVFTPRTYPRLLAYCLLAVSGLGLVNALVNLVIARRDEGKLEKRKLTREELRDAVYPYLMYVLIIAYVLIYKYLGIIIATIIMPPIMLWFLKCRSWKAYAAFYVFAAVIYLLFTKILLVPIR